MLIFLKKMNVKRIKELQEFADEFDKQLKNSEESYELNLKNKNFFYPNRKIKKSYSSIASNIQNKTMISKYKIPISIPIINQKPKRNTKSCKKKQGKISGNIYKNLLPWIPPHYIGNYFESFKILKDRHNLSAWEKVNIKIFLIFFIYRIGLVYVKEVI